MNKVFFIILFFSSFALHSSGQSLVIGGDFDDPATMPEKYGVVALQKGCFPAYSTPDLFNKNSTKFGVINPSGSQEPYNGDGYSGFLANERELTGFALSERLNPGERYIVSYAISSAESSDCALTPIVARLATRPYETMYESRTLPAYVRYDSYKSLLNFEHWTVVTDTITAKGGEEYLIIGYEDLDRKHYTCRSYYYLDNVVLKSVNAPLDEPDSVLQLQEEKLSVYYETNKIDLTESEKSKLLAWVETFADKSLQSYTVVGSADPQGNREYNETLALNRAKNVITLLDANLTSIVASEYSFSVPEGELPDQYYRRVDITIRFYVERE
jgi:outer membrane protein OmpA-like peptidoglycan-associated protein